MQQQAAGVVAGRTQSKKLHVGHVRNPRQRMPIGHDRGAKRPGHVGGGDAGLQMAILRDVAGIVGKRIMYDQLTGKMEEATA